MNGSAWLCSFSCCFMVSSLQVLTVTSTFPKPFRWCGLRGQGWSRPKPSTGLSTWLSSITSKHYSAGSRKSRYGAGGHAPSPFGFKSTAVYSRVGNGFPDKRASQETVPTWQFWVFSPEVIEEGTVPLSWPASLRLSRAGWLRFSQACLVSLELGESSEASRLFQL